MAEEKNASDGTAPAGSSQQSEDKGTFVPLIFGGAVACAIGFFAGQIESVEERLGFGDKDNGLAELVEAQAETLASQSDMLTSQGETIEALTARLTDVEAVEIPEVDLSGVEGGLASQSETLTALAARIDEIEKRPMTEGLSEEAVAAYEVELSRLQGSVAQQQAELQTVIDAQRAEIEALVEKAKATESSAEERARVALARAAMSKIITAVNSGEPYATALADLEASGGADVPDALAANAAEGVPTVAALQAAFPAAARAALGAARSGDNGGSFGGFLQKQLGVRSVAPREGDDPDAILSRAEAAVRSGQIGDALAEIGGLPDQAKAEMANWTALAETRHAASVAADELMTALATN